MTLPSSGTLTLQQIATEFNQQLPFGLLNNPAALDSAPNIQNAGNIGLYGVNGLVPNYYNASLGRTGTAGGSGWSGNGSAGSPYTKTAGGNAVSEYVGTVSLGYAPTQAANPLPITVTGSFALSGSGITCSMDTSGNVYATTTGVGFKSVRWQFNFTRSPASGSVAHTIVFDINYNTTGAIVNPLPGGFISAVNPSGGATARVFFYGPDEVAASCNRFDGQIVGDVQPPTTCVLQQQWFNPSVSGIGANYWVRATYLSGYGPGGPRLSGINLSLGLFGQWYRLNQARAWTLNANILGLGLTTDIFFEICADNGGGSPTGIVLTSGTYTLAAEWPN